MRSFCFSHFALTILKNRSQRTTSLFLYEKKEQYLSGKCQREFNVTRNKATNKVDAPTRGVAIIVRMPQPWLPWQLPWIQIVCFFDDAQENKYRRSRLTTLLMKSLVPSEMKPPFTVTFVKVLIALTLEI